MTALSRLALAELHAVGRYGTLTVNGHPAGLSVRVARSFFSRLRGFIGERVTGGLLLYPCSAVHTFGVFGAVEVAYLDQDLRVLEIRTLKPWRRPPIRLGVAVLMAGAGELTGHQVQPYRRVGLVGSTG